MQARFGRAVRRGGEVGHRAGHAVQRGCEVRNRAAVDAEAGGGRAGHVFEGFEAGFLHRVIRFFVIGVAADVLVDRQKPRVLARTFVVDLAGRFIGRGSAHCGRRHRRVQRHRSENRCR